jgi:hypothetical protein
MVDGGDVTGAHSVRWVEMENAQGREANAVACFGNTNYSRPNELTQDVEIPAPRIVRVVRTIHVGLPATANASTPGTDTSTTTFKGLALQIAEFFINHPILAMLVLGLTALIGFVLTMDV